MIDREIGGCGDGEKLQMMNSDFGLPNVKRLIDMEEFDGIRF
jgi:hypothetical protein